MFCTEGGQNLKSLDPCWTTVQWMCTIAALMWWYIKPCQYWDLPNLKSNKQTTVHRGWPKLKVTWPPLDHCVVVVHYGCSDDDISSRANVEIYQISNQTNKQWPKLSHLAPVGPLCGGCALWLLWWWYIKQWAFKTANEPKAQSPYQTILQYWQYWQYWSSTVTLMESSIVF